MLPGLQIAAWISGCLLGSALAGVVALGSVPGGGAPADNVGALVAHLIVLALAASGLGLPIMGWSEAARPHEVFFRGAGWGAAIGIFGWCALGCLLVGLE